MPLKIEGWDLCLATVTSSVVIIFLGCSFLQGDYCTGVHINLDAIPLIFLIALQAVLL